jgi:hypothetical protein
MLRQAQHEVFFSYQYDARHFFRFTNAVIIRFGSSLR